LKPIAIVVLNWNGKALLEAFLPSVVAFSNEAQIYVADNASTDDSVLWLERTFPEVKIIQNIKNYGFAQGYNEALKQIGEPIFALVNSDIAVTKNWLQPILKEFQNKPHVGIMQPKIKSYTNQDEFEYAGAAGGFIDKYGYPYCRGRIFDTIEQDYGQYDDTIDIFWASGACLFIRKEIFDLLDGFDPDFFAHQEEIDLCWRAFNKDIKVVYCGNSEVYHMGGGTLSQTNAFKTYLNFRNSLLTLLKNAPKKALISIIFIRLILDGIAGFRFVIQGKFNHFIAIIRAHFSFYTLLFKTLRKREQKQHENYFRKKSIVYQYFIKKGKVFEN
jgi:GT2 family glycosyltransferase